MDSSKANLRWVFPAVAALVALLAAAPAKAQIPVSPCTASMLTSFTPCMNFLTNNTANFTTPTPGCCTSLMSLARNSSGCLCQILTGGVPFQVPVNRTTAISLPRSCNMSGVPFQCNVATSPPPAPVPNPFAQAPGAAAPPPTSTASTSASPAVAPVSDTTPSLTPPASPSSAAKTSNTTTSAAKPSRALSRSLLILPLALVMIKGY